MFVKRLTRNIFDVFFDNGWSGWVRVRRNHWGVSYLEGNPLTREQKTALNQRFYTVEKD